jgi:hypothetical protein
METWLTLKSQIKSAEHMDNDILPIVAAEYQGKQVTLNKPFRTKGGKKKFAVYVQNSAGRVVIVRFGDPNMEIKRDDPKRRKAFRDRHNCSEKKDRTTPGYWSCRQWRGSNKVEATLSDEWESNEEQPIFADIEEIDEDCCDDCSEHAEAKMIRKDVFDNPAEANKRAKEMGLDGIHSHEEDGEKVFMPGKTHEEYMSKNKGKDIPEDASYDDDEEKEASYGKVLKRDNIAADEPAPPKDRKKGSKKNPKDSAKDSKGGITFSESVTKSLSTKAKEHNAKSDKKVTLGMLKSVYRRGSGAYSTSHREGISRAAWSMARVNAFLKLVRSGKPSNPKYVQDNDLLPSNHSRKSKKASEDCSCPIGEELVAGVCQPVNVTMEVSVDSISAKVEASTGQSIIEIKGIAFHEGYNKNNWSLTRRGAEAAVSQMFGADLTLNHPKAKDIGFDRNTDGGVNEANVGVVTSATINDIDDDKYEVRYVAHVMRAELFEALESGLWMKPEYGVSIGGYGVPIKADKEGMVFDTDFTFDHLAIVHKPAYNRANIEEVKRLSQNNEVASDSTTFIGHSLSGKNQPTVNPMSEDTQEETILASEMESIQAELVLARAEIEQYKANEAAKAEEIRSELVAKASELGLKGHEDLSTDTITSLIASWEASRPVVEEKVLAPAEPASEPAVASEAKTASEPVVANYLNGKVVETPESVYSQAWNAWASTWNSTLSGQESSDNRIRAPKYSELKEMN